MSKTPDPDKANQACVDLAAKIREKMGAGWTELPGLHGREKEYVFYEDGSVSLVAGEHVFWQRPDDGGLMCAWGGRGRWYLGSWDTGELAVLRMGPSVSRA